ncbi:TRAP transporter substrate-binding protein [Rhodoplanes sp. Z2-YC6860]|uniref:TRAP transporter substrate-binding protein n=1 Tax=Rhodoplanes sp. Z2-YC6860 TaxID=674703 RepID=UPI00078CC075|nr:TRAP transporter substrate-binding protein [Rhodoplanes sp. Z2-YC6860]AMN44190.1 TRAP dicarboxylate transporter subunit DctP [Rhodoplanes sp. Z2-YC6860]
MMSLKILDRITSRKSIVIAGAAAALLSLQTPCVAQVVWQMATEYPQSAVSGTGLATFGKLVAERTRGAVTTATAFDNALKITSGEMLRAAAEKRIAGGDPFAGPLEAADAIFGLPSLPFVVQSIDAAKELNTRARPLYERALEKHGAKLLYITIWPSTGLWSERTLQSAADLRAIAVRTYDNSSTEVMRAAGATAEPLPFNDAVERLKNRTLNAVLTSGDGGAGRKLWDYLRHFTPINYAVPISVAFVRLDAFNALPKDVQDQVMAAAAETQKSQFELLANRTADNYARMRSNGVGIAETVPASVMIALRQGAAAPIAAWKTKVPAEASAIVDGMIRQ